jgi:hypothetical protein
MPDGKQRRAMKKMAGASDRENRHARINPGV